MEIIWTKKAQKALARVPANVRAQIVRKIDAYAADPASQANNVKALNGIDALRLRVGNWRVIFTADGRILTVLRLGPRGSIY